MTMPDPVATHLQEVQERWDTAENAVYSTLLGRAQALVSLADIPRLVAALEAALAALARHQKTITDKHGTVCAGCLSGWPCPDSEVVARELLGTKGEGI